MSNSFFRFKQFAVHQDKCAMKVGTDGVLLGAWADVNNCRSALDVGTGTGLVALMLAQRNPVLEIVAVDIDEAATEQALENVYRSPWKERISVRQVDFSCYNSPSLRFDLIVSNPPYFKDSLKSPCELRNAARHTDSLRFEQLISGASELLSFDGRFCVIIPADAMGEFVACAEEYEFGLFKRLLVRTKPDAAPKRVLLEFRKGGGVMVEESDLVVELARHQYSEAYTELTREFYLKM
ncbi:MAG: tRNA1(Val) (adenine(37)-N6)-methyltransferase [Phocaeicola sp.]